MDDLCHCIFGVTVIKYRVLLSCLCHFAEGLPVMKGGYDDLPDESPRADDHQEMTMTSHCCWQALNRVAYTAWQNARQHGRMQGSMAKYQYGVSHVAQLQGEIA